MINDVLISTCSSGGLPYTLKTGYKTEARLLKWGTAVAALFKPRIHSAFQLCELSVRGERAMQIAPDKAVCYANSKVTSISVSQSRLRELQLPPTDGSAR